MATPPSSASEWTSAVETAVQAELLRRSRRLKWAVVLSLLVGATAVAVALALRGVTWAERLAPVVKTQISQGQAQIAMDAELTRLEAEQRRIEAELRARIDAPDEELQALRHRVQRLERAIREAATDRARLAAQLESHAHPAPGAAPPEGGAGR
jgi:TolA-binding protein